MEISYTIRGITLNKSEIADIDAYYEAACTAEYIIENKTTVREAAKKFGISKSTVHIDVSERLKKVNPSLYNDVRKILDINKAERHIRGGMATKQKFNK